MEMCDVLVAGTQDRYTDVQGFSHAPRGTLVQAHQQHPDKPLFLSECCSCPTMRGEDATVPSAQAANSSDPCHEGGIDAPGCDPGLLGAYNADCLVTQSNASDGLDFMVGTEVWTLMDY